MNKKLFRKIIHWGLLVIIIVFIITGLGIFRYKIIESITFGLITKPISFQVHTYLTFPLVVFLYLHILLTWKRKKKRD
ncbi:MAG: hypothetical protein AYK22_08485 [Thermoplasmatales archaeon SG8-52-3]|jgi:thiosulfate reductase cytochrome b subunit|nr:MAG: hypothetical protein AYK22_08485 [Thermoplasmatales archaeon SG8-52-3]